MKPYLKEHLPPKLLTLLARLPLATCRKLGRLAGSLLWHSHSRSRQTTLTNISACFPELTDKEQLSLARKSLVESAITLTEMPSSWLWSIEDTLKLIVEVEGEDLLRNALASGKGVIVAAPHLGNWEILGLYLATLGPITSLYQPPKSKQLDQLIFKARKRNGAKLAPTNRKGVSQLLKALQNGEMVGILPDQEPERHNGVFAPFFGVDALTMTLLTNLAQKTDPLIVTGWAKRCYQPDGYKIIFREANSDIYSQDAQMRVNALNKSVETCVREAPEQYQWEYKRFKKQPENKPGIY